MLHSIIAYALEKCLPFRYNGKVVNYVPDFIVPRNVLHLFRLFHERHKLLHEVELVDNEDEFLNRDLDLSVDQNSNRILEVLGVYFIVLSIFLVNPVLDIELFLIPPYILHLLLYGSNQFPVLLRNLPPALIKTLQVLLSVFVGFIDYMVVIGFNHFMKVLLFVYVHWWHCGGEPIL